jgi:DNA-binding NarL/FixJ family response regulator
LRTDPLDDHLHVSHPVDNSFAVDLSHAAVRRETDHRPAATSRRNESISVLVVDDHADFRAGLTTLLAEYGFDVVGDAADGETALALVEELAPDVVLMDLHMPQGSGLSAAIKIAGLGKKTAVLMLTVSGDEESVAAAMLGGARGYLVKGTSPEGVVAAINAVARGDTILSAEVASRLFAHLGADGARVADDPRTSLLSPRELEILRLLAGGRQNHEIADQLVISPLTVRNHISNLLRKLQLENRTQAAAYAVRHRL